MDDLTWVHHGTPTPPSTPSPEGLLTLCYQLGEQAYRDGKGISDNPFVAGYAPPFHEAEAWRRGYEKAKSPFTGGTAARTVIGVDPAALDAEQTVIRAYRYPVPRIGEQHTLMFMAQAFAIAERSHARDLKVGALLVEPQADGTHRVISDGYNGTEPGTCNRCEDDEGNQLPGVIHAERNVFRKIMRSREDASGCWLFVTRSPCEGCTERILDADVAAVFYCEQHRDTTPLTRLKSRGVHCKRVPKRHMTAYFDSISARLRQPKFNEA